MSEGKKRLLELEKTGKYFFHGSPDEIERFEPRQAYDWTTGERKEDGPPAIFASPSIDYAIFMAIINKKNCPKGYRSGAATSSVDQESDDFKIKFHAEKSALDQLTESCSGWVHIFDRKDFPNRKISSEYFSVKHVVPIEKILVKKEDLPENIEIR